MRAPAASRRSPFLLALSLFVAGCPAPSPLPGDDAGERPMDGSLDSGRDTSGTTDTGDPCAEPDRDGDGEDAIACGGLDCDDDDPQRAPGRTEFCDPSDRDEDCDPSTYGIRDLDLDGAPDVRCCNADPAGGSSCGTDCDDARPGVSPTATETCNAIDDDCDGGIDEGVSVALYPDADGDGYGDDGAATPTMGCPGTAGFAALRGDCDDGESGVHVGATESCNGIDDDCDGDADDIVDGIVFCELGELEACATSCGRVGTRTCDGSCQAWTRCSGPEACNGCDDDGDGVDDNGFEGVGGSLVRCTTACGTEGDRTCAEPACTPGICRAAEVCNFCDDDRVNGTADERALATLNDPARPLSSVAGRYVGGAVEIAENLPGGRNGSDIFALLLDGTTDVDTGGVWFDLARYQGWGTTTIHVEMEVRAVGGGIPYGGWSVLVADGGTGDLGPPENFGGPTTRTGIRADWAWSLYERVPSMTPGRPILSDGGRYGEMTGAFLRWEGTIVSNEGFTQTDWAAMFNGEPSWIRQDITIVYTPENTATPVREERAQVYFGGFVQEFYPGMTTMPAREPMDDLPTATDPSRVLSIGITAGTHRYTDPETGDVLSANVEARVRLRGWEFFPVAGMPPRMEWYDHSTIARNGICPGGAY